MIRVLSNNEKSLLLYCQIHKKAFVNIKLDYSNTILSHTVGLDEEYIENAITKLVDNNFIIIKNPDEGSREIVLTPKGSLYKFSSRWSIATSIGIGITTVAAVLTLGLTLYPYIC